MILEHKSRRRWFGAACLLAAITMLVAGETVLKKQLSAVGFLLYWMACLGFTVLAIIAALVDVRAVRLQSRSAQKELFDETLRTLDLQ